LQDTGVGRGAFAFGGRGFSVGRMAKSPDDQGGTVSHEAIFRWIYAVPKGELAREEILLHFKQSTLKHRKPLGQRTGSQIVGMVSNSARLDTASVLRVPKSWEADPVGKAGWSAFATLVERSGRFLIMLGPPEGKKAAGLADVLIDRVNDLRAFMRGFLTWDQGTEMVRHAQVTVTKDLPVYFAHPPLAVRAGHQCVHQPADPRVPAQGC